MFMQNRNDFIEKLLDRAQIEEGMRVLDIGCATGEVTQLIAKRVGANGEVVGVDVNEYLKLQMKPINITMYHINLLIYINCQKLWGILMRLLVEEY